MENESCRKELVKQQQILRVIAWKRVHFISSINDKVLFFGILMLGAIISQWIPEVFSLELR